MSLKNCARVHFIPNLKVGVFVILCAPDVIKIKSSCLHTEDALEDESKMRDIAIILDERDIKSLQTQLIDSDSTFGITENHFPDRIR